MPTSESPRILYIGAERVGLACLERLHQMGKNVVAVITAEDGLRPKIADWASFDDFVRDTGVYLYKVRSTKSPEVIELVKCLRPDLICVVSWSMIIPPEILETPPRGCVGFHYSLLPERRGGAPLNWAIIDGLDRTGITLFYMDDGIDTGDIIDQQAFDIGRDDTVKDLLDKIVAIAPELLARNIDDIQRGKAKRVRQDHSRATYTSRRRPEDGEIDWSKPDQDIYNLIRALAPPYPCAFTTVNGRRLVFPAAKLEGGTLKLEAYLE